VPKLSASEVEVGTEMLKDANQPGTDQTPAELIKAGIEQFALRFINLKILFGKRRNCL
jgi:hypothetical protein